MNSKVINFISKEDNETYLIVIEALKIYDDYLHSVNNVNQAIKVRALLKELNTQKNERIF